MIWDNSTDARWSLRFWIIQIETSGSRSFSCVLWWFIWLQRITNVIQSVHPLVGWRRSQIISWMRSKTWNDATPTLTSRLTPTQSWSNHHGELQSLNSIMIMIIIIIIYAKYKTHYSVHEPTECINWTTEYINSRMY